jgi:hypothetical protein
MVGLERHKLVELLVLDLQQLAEALAVAEQALNAGTKMRGY